MVDSASPVSSLCSRSTTRQCVNATSSRKLETQSQIHPSRVPRCCDDLIFQRISSIWARVLLTVALAGADDTARYPFAGVTGAHRRRVGTWCAVDLAVALRRNVAEVVGTLVNDDGGLLTG